ncbi:hypothetical protein ACHAXA_009844 [Cyclostephanos tholiformis]|uniref:Uncharacterized protein n=1 Tax=Cyclostephanos tholiformis TaxID=382380 RepID=A0ABD3R6N8_9STRA
MPDVGGGARYGSGENDDPGVAATVKPTRRRTFLERSIAIISIPPIMTSSTVTAATIAPPPAMAGEMPVVTKRDVEEAFDDIRYELQSPGGVVSTLSRLIDSGSCDEVMQYTKESDAYFRKAKLGRARRMLTDDKLRKGDSIYISNAVTFDLIGINRASRPGKENKDEQLKYLDELRRDIEKFLELEGTIAIGDGESRL